MKKILVLGAAGRLGATVVAAWEKRYKVVALARGELDIADLVELERKINHIDAEWVVNCSGLTSLEACEENPEMAYRINAEAVGKMAEICSLRGKRLIHFSTDYVFDGEKGEPYLEEDEARPLGIYGKSKLDGERKVLVAGAEHFVFRVSWVFGIGRPAFPDAVIQRALESEKVVAVTDKWSAPTSASDIARWLIPVLEEDGGRGGGLYHLCNTGACSWLEYAASALRSAKAAGIPVKTICPQGISLSSFGALSAPRPAYSTLATDKFFQRFSCCNRSWQDALDEYVVKQVKPNISAGSF